MNRSLSILIFLISYLAAFSQSPAEFGWPIDTPHIITGNYGELRPNHFHMGWDFSTRGKINLPVYAIADGYVSRIKVSATGYGKAVYITYPGNRLSLHGHLTAYAGEIAAVVKKEQYAKQGFEIEMFPAKNEIRVTKGQLIGYSGNTGGSTGPHLHFEIRDHKTEVPLNLLDFYNLHDTIRPTLNQVAFYNLADTNHPAFLRTFKVSATKKDSLFLKNDSIILSVPLLGFAFNGFDRFSSKGSANVIYKAKLYLDNALIFNYTLNNIAFDWQRYVNEFSETVDKIKYQKCFLPTIYPAAMYGNCYQKGRIQLTDTNYHLVKLIVNDEQGNQQMVQFSIKAKSLTSRIVPTKTNGIFIDCSKDFITTEKNIRVFMPSRTLYYSSTLVIENTLDVNQQLKINLSSANLGSAYKLGFLVPVRLKEYQAQLVLQNGTSVFSPRVNGDSLNYNVSVSGTFKLLCDTTAPKIKTQLSPKKIKTIKKMTTLSFIIRDNISGLGKYNLYLNDKWILAEFDAKVNLLTYYFDNETPGGDLSFRVDTEDKVGNKSTFSFLLKQ